MRMRLLITVGILLVSSTLFAAKTLPIAQITQQKDQWCWAGASKMILDYHNIEATQGEIVQFALGDSLKNRPNYLWGSGQFTYNGVTQHQEGVSKILEHWGFAGSGAGWNAGEYLLTEAQWKENIDAEHPFIINWSWSSGGGHYVVAMGYLDNGTYEVMNPWFGTGYVVNTYNWMKTAEGGRGTWQYTLTTLRNPPLGLEQHLLTVDGGTGTGYYEFGEKALLSATLTANDSFIKWSGGGAIIADSLSASTSITMGDSPLTVTAVLSKKELLISPNGGEEYHLGDTVAITWNPSNFSGALLIGLQGIVAGGQESVMENLTFTAPNTGSYDWVVSDTLGIENWEYSISLNDGVVSDISEQSFSLKSRPVALASAPQIQSVPPSLRITQGVLHLQGLLPGATTVELFSVNGRMIMSKALNLSSGTANIGLPTLPQGVILVRVSGENNSFIQKLTP